MLGFELVAYCTMRATSCLKAGFISLSASILQLILPANVQSSANQLTGSHLLHGKPHLSHSLGNQSVALGCASLIIGSGVVLVRCVVVETGIVVFVVVREAPTMELPGGSVYLPRATGTVSLERVPSAETVMPGGKEILNITSCDESIVCGPGLNACEPRCAP